MSDARMTAPSDDRQTAETRERLAEILWRSDHPHTDDPSWSEWLAYLADRGNPPALSRDVDACRRRAGAILADHEAALATERARAEAAEKEREEAKAVACNRDAVCDAAIASSDWAHLQTVLAEANLIALAAKMRTIVEAFIAHVKAEPKGKVGWEELEDWRIDGLSLVKTAHLALTNSPDTGDDR